MVEPSSGFILMGGPWEDGDAAAHARQGKTPSDYVVVTHLKAHAGQWIAEIRFIRTIDGTCLDSHAESFRIENPAEVARKLSRQVFEWLHRLAKVPLQPLPELYAVPDENLHVYLLRLEQLLAVRCNGMEQVVKPMLNGEREILDGNLQQCLRYPTNVNFRILLWQTCLAMKRVRPDVVQEFTEKLVRLQEEHPLPEPARASVNRLVQDALGSTGGASLS